MPHIFLIYGENAALARETERHRVARDPLLTGSSSRLAFTAFT